MIQVLDEPLPRIPIDELGDTNRQKILVMGGGGIAPAVVTGTISIVQNLLEKGFHPIGLPGSWEAVANEGSAGVIDFSRIPSDILEKLLPTGGTCLGPGRGMLLREQFRSMGILKQKIGFRGAVGVGGDGTISGAQALQYSLDENGAPICDSIWGVKTIDGDVEGSLSMGFMTSAMEYAKAIQIMLREIQWEKSIGIVGVYGRNNGHLALRASTLAVRDSLVITLVPEFKIERETFLKRLRDLKQQYGYVCVVVSEGFSFHGEEQMIDERKKDGAGNSKLLGCVDLIRDVVIGDTLLRDMLEKQISFRTIEPSILTRSCDPIPADIALGEKIGPAVAELVERDVWGHAVTMQGTYNNGFHAVPIPLWQIRTGNPVTDDLYDATKLSPRDSFRDYSNNQDPDFGEHDLGDVETLKRNHARLIGDIFRGGLGDLIEHNGVLVPHNAIEEDERDGQRPTIWTGPIRKMLAV